MQLQERTPKLACFSLSGRTTLLFETFLLCHSQRAAKAKRQYKTCTYISLLGNCFVPVVNILIFSLLFSLFIVEVLITHNTLFHYTLLWKTKGQIVPLSLLWRLNSRCSCRNVFVILIIVILLLRCRGSLICLLLLPSSCHFLISLLICYTNMNNVTDQL